MTRLGRVGSTAAAGARSFLRRRTAVFFTFFFPVLLVVIFGALVNTGGGTDGLFTEPPAYYVPGYLAVVVLFTPLSRVGSAVARHREGNRFEKLATTPLTRPEWLAAQTLVNVAVIGLAALLVLGLVVVLTGASLVLSPLLVAFVVLAVTVFCGVGSVLGCVADSRDGVIAASNALALPLLFLSDTFVPPRLLPDWFGPVMALSPLTYFSRGARAVTGGGASGFGSDPLVALGVLAVLAVAAFAAGAVAIPTTD